MKFLLLLQVIDDLLKFRNDLARKQFGPVGCVANIVC